METLSVTQDDNGRGDNGNVVCDTGCSNFTLLESPQQDKGVAVCQEHVHQLIFRMSLSTNMMA